MRLSSRNLILFIVAIICYALISSIHREQFLLLFSLVSIAFFSYVFLSGKDLEFKSILILGIVLRLCFFSAEPNLSDDVFRFVWDGEVMGKGMNPYEHLPSDLNNEIGEGTELYESLNSKNYYSVYPPMMQSVFYIISSLPDNLFLKTTILRILLLLSELAVVVLLGRILQALKLSKNGAAIYALNPLVIIETIGNLHFESMMICFFLFGFYLLVRSQKLSSYTLVLAALFFAFGIMTKLTLALILAVLLFFIPIKKLLKLALLTFTFSVLLFLPFLSDVLIQNFTQSLDLYFRSFEFNASVFYLVNAIGTKIKGWDTVQFIGPSLSMLSLLLISIFCVFRKKPSWLAYFNLAQMAFFIYLLFATTVHPWYLLNLIFLSVFTKKIYPILWSLLIYLSYYMYSNDLQEPPLLLTIEYAFVGVLFLLETFSSVKINRLLKRVPLFQADDNQE